MRNTMNNRVVSDVFIPKGSRLNTIDILNYKIYLQDDSKPSPLIVEAANLFINGRRITEKKDKISTEVLTKLRELAKMEATLLLREFITYPGSLPCASKVTSKAINSVKDEVLRVLDSMKYEEVEILILPFKAHLPKTKAFS